MKYYIIAGEASGDLHGSNLIKALQKEDANASFRVWGGDLMRNAGATLVKHYKEMAFMGFVEVLKNIPAIFKNISFCKKDIEEYQPDLLVFIDYSGFNLRIAKWAKKKGFRTNYYISPQVWASRPYRVKKIKRDIDQMFVIFPFVKDFYEKHQYKVDFVGHPLLDAIHNREKTDVELFKKQHSLDERPIIAILPGSRKQEITQMLSVMLSLVDKFKEYQFVIAGAPSQKYEFYEPFINQKDVKFIDNQTYDLLSVAYAGLVTSGTATLETALFKVPQVVCYKANNLSYQIAKRIIQIKYISLVNLVLNREVVTELIQNDFTTEKLSKELTAILKGNAREKQLSDYEELERKLGGQGASQKTAHLMVSYLKNEKK